MKLLLVISALICASLAQPSGRVVGGFQAKEGSAPYQVSLRDQNFGHFCGGSILNKRWILTAAHCLYNKPSDSIIRVYVGSNHLFGDGEYYNVEKRVLHKQYNGPATRYQADIALLKVSRDIVYRKYVQPIALHQEFVEGGEKLKVTGWGLLHQDAKQVPLDLQELHPTSVSGKDCKAKTGINPVAHLCGFKANNQGVCMGDSGGPLVLNGEQVGVVSFGLNGCANGKPDFYTRVSLYLDWVNEHISK